MPLMDISNPRIINFLCESYEKEARLRMVWGEKFSSKFQTAASFRGEPKNYNHADIIEATCHEGLAATTRDHIVAARHRKTAPMKDYLLVKVDKIREEQPLMLPVAKEVKALLNESSVDYLKKRYKLNPEDKYYFAEASSWKYGWRLADSPLKAKRPEFPNVARLQRALFSRVGPQPDPSYYQSAFSPTFSCDAD